MKISVITVCYNSEENIATCLDSYASQTYSDKELIVIDGASTDRTLSIVQRYRPERLVSERDKGLYYALNKGVTFATGDVVCFLHSDDVFGSPNVLENIASIFEKYNTDSVYADLQYVSKNDISHVVRNWHSGKFTQNGLRRGWMPPHPSFFVKKSVYERYGLFDTRYKIAADYDIMMRFLGKYRISTAYCPIVAVKMRVGGASNRSLKNIILKTKEDFLIARANNIGGLFTVVCKNFRKLNQFCAK